MNGVLFEETRPAVEVSPNRADVVCFIGYVCRSESPLPETVKDWLQGNGWRPLGVPVANDDEVLHTPVPVDNFETFNLLFDWEDRPDGQGVTWLGAAVRSFFAQGGSRCLIVRAGDVGDLGSAESLRQLVPGYAGGSPGKLGGRTILSGSSGDRETWHGIEVLYGLEEAAFVCLPDLPELVADAALELGKLPEPVPAPEEFSECSVTVAPPDDTIRPQGRSPACTADGFGRWFDAANAATRFLYEHRKDVQLILAVPLPAEGSGPQTDLMRALNLPGTAPKGLAARMADGANGGIATAFLQLVYPWLGTDTAPRLPGGLEPPDGVLAGVAARTVAMQGAHRSLGRQPLRRVSRFFPPTTLRDRQLQAPPDDTALIQRVSLLGDAPTGPRVLSDVTTSLNRAHRAASVGRITAAILRAAGSLGEVVTFDSAGPTLWRRIERQLDSLMGRFFRAGALLGQTAEEAYTVRCDETTTSPNDEDNGRVIAVITFTPAQPVGVITVVLSLREDAMPVAENLE